MRFFAAAAVVLHHFTARANPSWGIPVNEAFPTFHTYTAWGAFGVDLFFVISGFVILMTSWGRDVPAFVSSRVSRLFPAFWVCVLLSGFLLVVLWPEGKPMTLTQVAANLTMMHPAIGMGHVDGVYWTLWAELRFYVLIAVFMAIGMTRARILAFALLWPPVAAIADRSGADFLATVLISDYAPLFAGGMMLFLVLREPRSLVPWLVLGSNVLLGMAWSGGHSAWRIEQTTSVPIGQTSASIAIVVCFALVAVAVLTPLKRISWRWMTTLGALTYPLYLIHEYWGWWFIRNVHAYVPSYVALGIAIAAVLLMAWLINRFVERPFARPLRRAVERSLRSTASPLTNP
ncbi:acyltransferase [Agromyces terreus]